METPVKPGGNRRQPNKTEQIQILLRQALCGCGCGQRLEGRKVEYHHMHERALGGPDHVDNWAALVADDNGERNCHGVITNGTKATKAGSSKHKIAKARRLEAARLALANAEKGVPAFLTERFETVSGLDREPREGLRTSPSPAPFAERVFLDPETDAIVREPIRAEDYFLIPKGIRRPGKFPKRPKPTKRGKR